MLKVLDRKSKFNQLAEPNGNRAINDRFCALNTPYISGFFLAIAGSWWET